MEVFRVLVPDERNSTATTTTTVPPRGSPEGDVVRYCAPRRGRVWDNENEKEREIVSCVFFSRLFCFCTHEINKQYQFQAFRIKPRGLWHLVTRTWIMNSPETWNNDFMFHRTFEDVELQEIQSCSYFMCLRILSHLSRCHRKYLPSWHRFTMKRIVDTLHLIWYLSPC